MKCGLGRSAPDKLPALTEFCDGRSESVLAAIRVAQARRLKFRSSIFSACFSRWLEAWRLVVPVDCSSNRFKMAASGWVMGRDDL